MTVNEYTPGQGIASHIDTTSCFGADIYIVSMGSDVVMHFISPGTDAIATVPGDGQSDSGSGSTDGATDTMESAGKPLPLPLPLPLLLRRDKYVRLPRRSLLVLQGEARYDWSHAINPRKYDKVNDLLIKRDRRLSLTFRQAQRPGAISSELLRSSELELDHVVRVYDTIAVHWNHTRGKRKVYWHRVKNFIDALSAGTLLADVGSGDGKYFGVKPDITSIGCDRSIKLLEVSFAPTEGHNTFCCDAVRLPLVSDAFDATLCIAVLHHMASVERRYAVIAELVRITRPGGEVMVQAWAFEQGLDSKRVFDSQDTMVPWKLNKRFFSDEDRSTLDSEGDGSGHGISGSSEPAEGACKHVIENAVGDLVFQRYCHVYKEGELENLCSTIPGCRILESGWDTGNWFVRLEKVAVDESSYLPECAIVGPECALPNFVSRSCPRLLSAVSGASLDTTDTSIV